MNDQEAISYLGQMDMEVGALLQQRRAGVYIHEVLQHYQKRTAEVNALAVQEQALKDSLVVLGQTLVTETEKIRAALVNAQQAANDELSPLQQKVATVRKSLDELEKTIKDREAFAAARQAQLEIEIEQKVATLHDLNDGIEQFKKQHGLGA